MLAALKVTASILKLRIGFFIALAALIGVLTGNGGMGWVQTTVFCVAVLGASGAAGAFNQYLERDIDRLMERTLDRPFASGRLQAGPIWPVTFAVLLAGSLLMTWSVGGGLATILVLFGSLTYALVYTVWLKRRTVWNVVVGGAAGSFALLAGAAAGASPFDPGINPVAVVLAAVLFLWTPPHFWALAAARAEDYRRAGIPMLPVTSEPAVWSTAIFAHVVVLVMLSLIPTVLGLGWIYGVFAALGGGWFLASSWKLVRAPEKAEAMATFRASLLHFSALSLGVMLDRAYDVLMI